jgi:pyridoxal 5'-phosphate synthase pdxS subunit
VVEAVRHARLLRSQIRKAQGMDEAELRRYAKELGAPFQLLQETVELGRLPVVTFAAGGIATPADAALMMQLGMDGVFVGSVSKLADPREYSRAKTPREERRL